MVFIEENNVNFQDSKNVITGKEKCDMLRKMRIKFAELNGIEFSSKDCENKICKEGTCPVCEAELDYLANQVKQLIDQGINIKFPQNEISVDVKDCEEVDEIGVIMTSGLVYDPYIDSPIYRYQQRLANMFRKVKRTEGEITRIENEIQAKKLYINHEIPNIIKKCIEDMHKLEIEKATLEARLPNQQRKFEEALTEKVPYEFRREFDMNEEK